MSDRSYWKKRIEDAWKARSIVWLAGARRSGKTTLAKSFKDTLYLNCDLPRVQRELEDIETFMKINEPKIMILDEIHRLSDPAIVLKIIADEFPNTKVLATGSSTLSTIKKFKDTLTDRKRTIHFTPVLANELESFHSNLKRRFLQGGLPPSLLAENLDQDFFAEWFESFFSRDIQDLYEIEKKQPFLKLLELILIRNGSLTEVTEMGKLTGLSRPTVVKYLEALEASQAIHVVKPYFKNPELEITHQPKIYGFDTGFVCYAKGWDTLRTEDYGHLLENLVLETIIAMGFKEKLHYWRTKNQHEVDFVIPLSSTKGILAIEVKWSSKQILKNQFESFRNRYPKGENWLICANEERVRTEKHGSHTVKIVPLLRLLDELESIS